MVYCGKPSRGCQMCRTRRIKCDETKPTCTQCKKSRRQCPGYKDDFDLVFRNETKATERRARRTQKRHISFQHGQASSVSNATKPEGNGSSSQELVPAARQIASKEIVMMDFMPVSVEEQAPCHFVSNYVVGTDQRTKGHFDFLLPMMKNEPADSHLSSAFSAVALASLANRPNTRSPQLRNQAIFAYAKALKATNLALQDPTHQKSDATLAAVLMLGFYETIMNERTNASAWGSHIDGATEIVRMRGKKQLRTKIGMSLFITVRGQMVVNCITSSKAPAFGKEWWYVDGPSNDFGVFITNLSLRVAELRAEINDCLASFPRTPEYFQKVRALIGQAQVLEQDYQQAVQNLPEHWVYHTVAWVDQIPGGDITKAEVYPGRVDMFRDIWVAWAWNNVRITRLYIAGAIVRCAAWICFPMDFRTTPEYATASKLCIDLVGDIIASVPYHLGWRVGQGGALKSGGIEGFSFSDGSFSNPKALGGFFCMYPLLSITCTDYITDSQRAWAKGRLLFINDVIGLNHAKVLSTFQLRLPSMIIRRDILVHSPSAAAAMMAAAAAAAAAQKGQGSPMTTISSVQSSPAAATITPASSVGSSPMSTGPSPVSYTLSLQQKDVMHHDQREKERKVLLSKASNSQGESVEKLIAVYLSV